LKSYLGFELPESEIVVLKTLEKVLSKDNNFTWENEKWRIEVKDNHIISLYLRKCNLTQFPDIISNLQHIKRLFFEDNKINILPEFLGNLEHLEYIRLQGNPIDTLPQWIEKRHPTVKSTKNWVVVVPSAVNPEVTFTIYLKDYYKKNIEHFANIKLYEHEPPDTEEKDLFEILETYLKDHTPQQILDLLNDRLLEFNRVKTNSKDLISKELIYAFAYYQFYEDDMVTPQIIEIIKKFVPLLMKNLVHCMYYYDGDKRIKDGEHALAFKRIMKYAGEDAKSALHELYRSKGEN